MAAALPVVALAGEPLDALVWRALGRGSPIVEQLLDQTPGLAAIAGALPEGFIVTLPSSDPGPAELELIQLWD